jgi:hypothetical protein
MECYPFAVTGQLCLGRGITFQSNGFLFDYAILPDMKVDANAYQCAARVLGNTADFDNGFPVTVYLSASMRARIERQERIAINTARRVAEEGWLTVGDEEIARIAGDAPAAPAATGRVSVNPDDFAPPEWREFKTLEEAKGFASRVREPKRDEEGYYLSSTTGKVTRLSYVDVIAMQGGKKTAGFDPKKMKVGKSACTMYVCYKNLLDKTSVVFVVGKLTRIA